MFLLFFLYYCSYYLVNPWGINISFGDRNEWDGKDSGAEARETETRMGEACSLKATAGKTTISIIRATTDCGREQGCPDSSTNLHLATSSNEHDGVTPGTVRNNWDHSDGSTLMVKMVCKGRFPLLLHQLVLIIKQADSRVDTGERGLGQLSDTRDSNPSSDINLLSDFEQTSANTWALDFPIWVIDTSLIYPRKLL